MERSIKKGSFALVTGAYWAFTLTDGALRVLVLLYLHQLGRSPLEIATLFLFYEAAGVLTNLGGGALGAKFGLRLTLWLGLSLQIVTLGLFGWLDGHLHLAWVMGLQVLSGVAKDFTKMSSKSLMRFLVPKEDSGGLLRVVSWLTGSKNTLKGVGFFLGGSLLDQLGFVWACWGMALVLCAVLLGTLVGLREAYGKSKKKISGAGWRSGDPRVFWLSLSRLVLFASRDVWFVLALPLYLSAQWGRSHASVGGFLALWVIGYGLVQALAPGWLQRGGKNLASLGLGLWTLALLGPLGALLMVPDVSVPSLAIGLGLFGIVFATCSALHSYLILHYACGETVAKQVGAYYSANAVGRFVGTLLSGALFQMASSPRHGLELALSGAVALVLLAAVFCVPLWRAEKPLAGGGSDPMQTA